MFLAGVNFVLHFVALKGNLKKPFKNEEFKYYLLTLVFLIPLFAIVLYQSHLSSSPLRDAAFQVVAIITTTGYSTADFDLWPHILRYLLVLLMFVGGCGGSTGGGMKFIRIMISVKVALQSVVQSVFPNAIVPIKFNGQAISDKMVRSVLAYFIVFMGLFFLGAGAFIVTEGSDLLTALTASIAALSNIGPGLADVGPTQNYAWVSLPGKWLLTFLMLAGRLELYSILILFVGDAWRK